MRQQLHRNPMNPRDPFQFFRCALFGVPLLLSHQAAADDEFAAPGAGLQREEATADDEEVEPGTEPQAGLTEEEPLAAEDEAAEDAGAGAPDDVEPEAVPARPEQAAPAPAGRTPREEAARERRPSPDTPATVDAEEPAEELPSVEPTAEEEMVLETPERPARPDRPDRPARLEQTERRERAERPDRPERPADPAPVDELDVVPAPAETEPERQAETEVREATREVERELGRRAAKIESPEEAQAVIDEILGAKSRISRAEMAREERVRPRLEAAERRRGPDRAPAATPEQRQEATAYFQRRLRGEDVDAPSPELLRLLEARRGRPMPPGIRRGVVIEEQVDFHRPRYLREGRRYVHFDSRASVPAILLAAEAMNYVQFQRVHEVAPVLYEEVAAPRAMPLPPPNYRDESALVLSYPVDEASMITSDDILFLQGSTQFADPYSYEIVAALAEAMKAIPAKERFVVEGHASAEGDYGSNMTLSQQRAERIVREMVRRGVSPYRLLPVGYGESEARHPAAAAEVLRSQDRRVVVFRLRDQPLAAR
ncbi:MAG: OmpA family protein [Akkermansiaceae bacterium]